MPALTDEQRIDLENKQLANALAKVNSGQVLTDREMTIVEAAHARSKAPATPPEPLFLQTTDLGFEVAVTEELEKRGIFDASRLLERKKEVFFIIAKMLGRQVPIRSICSICGVSAHTVQSVRDHPEAKLPVATQKESDRALMRLLVTLGLEGILERWTNDPSSVTALELAIIKDKLTVEEGGVTDRTEVIVTDDETKDFMQLMRAARSGMVMDAEEVSPKAATASALRLADSPQVLDIHAGPITRDTECPATTTKEP